MSSGTGRNFLIRVADSESTAIEEYLNSNSIEFSVIFRDFDGTILYYISASAAEELFVRLSVPFIGCVKLRDLN